MRRVALNAVLMIGLYPLGVICHEVVGHGLTGVLLGGRIGAVEILGFQVWPAVEWSGWSGQYGACAVYGLEGTGREHIMALGGATSTWLVSVIAVGMLFVRDWPRRTRAVLICLSLWWIDMFTYTLPSWGLPRSILWGQRTISEPYEAAKELGMPGWMFQASAVASSAMLLIALVVCLKRRASAPRDDGTHRQPAALP